MHLFTLRNSNLWNVPKLKQTSNGLKEFFRVRQLFCLLSGSTTLSLWIIQLFRKKILIKTYSCYRPLTLTWWRVFATNIFTTSAPSSQPSGPSKTWPITTGSGHKCTGWGCKEDTRESEHFYYHLKCVLFEEKTRFI